MDKRRRYTAVPWLDTLADLRPMGEPETTVECGSSIALGLLIPHPFGRGTDAILTIYARRGAGNDGGVISLAITNGLPIETPPAMNMTLLRGPVRSPEREEEHE